MTPAFPQPRQLMVWLLWLGGVAYATLLAPPDAPETWAQILRLSTGQVATENPVIVALFNLMGIWPAVYCGLLLADGQGQKGLRAWPFALGSFLLGAFALLPYVALRQPSPHYGGPKTRAIAFWDSRWLAGGLAVGALALAGWALLRGDWTDFVAQWRSSRFIHVMSLDFCALSVLFPVLVGDDLRRRGMGMGWRWLTAVPLLGPLIYALARSPLPTPQAQPTSARQAL